MKKTITPPLLKFVVAATALTIIFRFFMSYAIDTHSLVIMILPPISYFIGMFTLGFYFGKKDGNFLPIYDVGFRFHLATYLVFISISELWFFLGIGRIEYNIHLTALIWGIFLLLHFFMFLILRKKSYKGLAKEELFE